MQRGRKAAPAVHEMKGKKNKKQQWKEEGRYRVVNPQ